MHLSRLQTATALKASKKQPQWTRRWSPAAVSLQMGGWKKLARRSATAKCRQAVLSRKQQTARQLQVVDLQILMAGRQHVETAQ